MSNALANYLTTACTGTGQATFYNTKDEQEKVLLTAHQELMRDNRNWYAASIVLPMNDRSKQIILESLLTTGMHCDDGQLENQAIGFAISELPFNRTLNLFMDLIKRKVNNSRTRKLGQAIWAMIDEFRAIKYTSKLRKILRHCHIPEGDDPKKAEIHRWIYGGNTTTGRNKFKASDIQHNPKLKSRLLAPTVYEELFNLPFDIARDIAVDKHNKKPDEFQREFAGKDGQQGKGTITRKETMRARKSTKDTKIDFGRFSLYDLCMHAHKNPGDIAEVRQFVSEKARELGQLLRMPDKVALVVDNSISALGSADRQYHPLVVIECLMHMCMESGVEVSRFFTGPEPDGPFLTAEGDTNLRLPLVKALVSRPNLVIILSDGYENVRAGSVSQILSTDAVKSSGIHIMHLNPVVSVESKLPTRKLSDHLATFTLTTPEQLPMISLLSIASVEPKLLEPMFTGIREKLVLGDYKGAKRAIAETELPSLASLSEKELATT